MILNQLDVVSRANPASTRCYSVQPPTPFSFGGGPAKLQVQAVTGPAQLSSHVQGVQTHLQQDGVLHHRNHVPQPATAVDVQSARLPSTGTTVQQDAAKPPADYARLRPQWEHQQQLSHVPQLQQQQQQQQQQAHMQMSRHLSAQQQQQQQQHYQQHMHGYGSAQQQVRPAHAGQHVQQMTQLVLSCDNLLQLQAVLSIHLHQFPPSCITTAMQQLHKLRQQELSQPDSSSNGNMGPVMQAVQLQLAGQMTQALLRQLPVVSGSCLAGFLAAAASMRLVMPAPVLEQLAAHLVNKALRLACQQYTAAAAAAAFQHSAATNANSGAAKELQQAHSGSGSTHPQQQQQQQGQGPHVAALSAWALFKLKLRSDRLWAELVSIAGEQLACMSSHDCVMLAYACAKAGQHQPRMFSGLQQQLRPHASRLAPDSISCLLWSYAAAGQYHQSWVSLLVGAAADKMERFSPRDMATSLWACGRLRHADPRMLSALRVQALACMSDTPATSLSNLAWSLATLKVADEALTAAIISRAGQLAEGFTMQGLANVAWAVVKLQQQLRTNRAQQRSAQQDGWPGSRQPSSGSSSSSGPGSTAADQSSPKQTRKAAQELLSLLCSAAVNKVGTAKPQEVCNLLWACATLQYRHQAFFAAATARLTAVAGDLLPVDLSQALWALETLRFRHKQTHRALLLSALSKLHLFGPQALSNLTWAVASSGMHYPQAFPQAVAQQLLGMMHQMTPQGLANTLWALTKMAPVPQQLIHAASSHICAQLPMYNAQDLCNVAMVTAKSGYKEAHLLQDLAAAASSTATVTLRALGQHNGSTEALSPRAGSVRAYSTDRLRHRQLTGQGVCNLVWAFAGTGWCDAQLLEQLLQVAMLHLPQLQPRNVAALCQGFALLGQPFDGLLTALPAAGEAQHKSKKRAGPSLQYQQHMQHLAGLQDRLGAPSAAAVSELQLQAASVAQHLAGWPADSLALVLHGMVVTRVQDRQPAPVLAVLRLLNRKGVAEGLSPQRQRQVHMAFTQLALQWGVAFAGQPGGGQSCLSSKPAKANLSGGLLQMCSSTSQPSLLRQLLRDALLPENGESCCTATDACSTCGPEQASVSAPHVVDTPAAELGAASQAAPGALPPALETAHDVGSPTAVEGRPMAGQSGGPDVASLAAGLLVGGLAQLCMRSWQQHEAVRQLSRVEQEVVGALQAMGLQPFTQHWLQITYTATGSQQSHRVAPSQWASRALAVNVGLSAHTLGPGRCPLALCVLPPAALSSSLPRQVLGQTRLEHQCLQSAGWQVVWLSWEDWDSMAGNHAQQQALLKQLCGL